MTHELKRNTYAQLKVTLEDFSSETAQLDYKRKVPFVHIPDELLAQWDSYRIHLYEQDWFSQGLDPICVDALKSFDQQIQQFCKSHKDIEDVPDVFNNEDWKRIGLHSKHLLQIVEQYMNLEDDPNKKNADD